MRRLGKRQVVEETSERSSERTTTRGVPKPPKVSAVALLMRHEPNPWLNWPGCSENRKIELNNKLVTMQDKPISQPRFLDWDLCNEIGIGDDLDTLLMMRFVQDEEDPVEIPVWKRAFEIRENSYREWCMEFYSSLKLDKLPIPHLFLRTLVISFRLGGVEHKVTIVRFGVLTSLYTPEEEEMDYMDKYVKEGDLNSNRVKKRTDRVWYEFSGKEKYLSSVSRAKRINSPFLRVVHKMLDYSYLHRSSQHDKVYLES